MIVLPSVGKSSLFTLETAGWMTAGVTCSGVGLVAAPREGKASGSLVTSFIGLLIGAAVCLESLVESEMETGLASIVPT